MVAMDRSEIVFFDVETTVPTRPGQGFAILEFGAILVCPRKLVELQHYESLVRPKDLSHISSLSVRSNGISKDVVVTAPTFAEIADVVYDLLNARIWAGHNILRFDCARIREAFAEINRPPPEPRGTIDSLALLTQRFGRRAGDMKMASIATYFGLGQQTHRSLGDVRMNLEVLKYCSTVLFLESSLPDIFTENSWVSPNATTRSRSSRKRSPEQTSPNVSTPPSSHVIEENHPILSLMSPNTGEVNLRVAESNPARVDSFNMMALCDELKKEMEEEKSVATSHESSQTVASSVGSNESVEFVEPNDISISSISVTLAPFYRGTQKLQVLYMDSPLLVSCKNLKIRFGISTRFIDYAGRPRLNFVVDVSPSMCKILDEIDVLAQKLSAETGSSSEWRSMATRKAGYFNNPTIRLHIPTVGDGENMRWVTEIYQKVSSGPQSIVCSKFDVAELDSLISRGNVVDAFFSLDAYDYQQNAGIRLVAKKLVVHSNLA